jgi:hypothetical protein
MGRYINRTVIITAYNSPSKEPTPDAKKDLDDGFGNLFKDAKKDLDDGFGNLFKEQERQCESCGKLELRTVYA